jgi:hypothetical protein
MPIVNVNVTQNQAPIPNALMRTGALVSQGGTNKTAGSLTLITQPSDLTPLIVAPLPLTTLVWASGVVTATASSPHGFTNGAQIQITIAGAVPTGFNGTFTATVTSTTAFTYPVATTPGTMTTPGTYQVAAASQLTAMVTTWFAQGTSLAVYVLELGVGTVAQGVTALTTWLNANPLVVYRLLLPREWDANAGLLALAATYQATTAKLYFHVTTTNTTFSQYTNLQKSVVALIEAPGIPVTEFSAAAAFRAMLYPQPSSTNKVAPFSFTFLFGVTPWPTAGNGTLFAAWKAAGVNWVGTGAEGGISTAILLWGTGMDVRPVNYWYTVDWTQINVDLNISNAVINGSNDPINPLYLNQDGINRLQGVGASTLASGVTFGLILGTVVQAELSGPDLAVALDNGVFAGQAVINAVPFTAYYTANPSDYRTGTYNGYSVTMTPLRGFESITFNISVTDFVAP